MSLIKYYLFTILDLKKRFLEYIFFYAYFIFQQPPIELFTILYLFSFWLSLLYFDLTSLNRLLAL
jgi:hypothetical protein